MKQNNFLIIQTSNGEACIDFHCIVRVEALSNYSKIYFENGKVLVVSKVLQWLEDRLPNHNFIRVHRSHLVNFTFINNVDIKKMSSLILKDSSKIEISRRRKIEVERKFKLLAAA